MSEFNLNVIGDSGPFSRLGKSIGYQINYNGANFLVDCGAPVFQLLGSDGLTELNGIIGTHAHEDHKRWFTDIALYQKFSANSSTRIKLYGSFEVLEDYRRASGPALERTLTKNSREVLNLSFEDYIEPIQIGPSPKYRCKRIEGEDGAFRWRVVDQQGEIVSPRRAKVVRSETSRVPRMVVKDPEDEIWVDPETYYAYSDERFYRSGEKTNYQLLDDLSLSPLKAPAWHGPPTTSLLFESPAGDLFFSSDTVYDPELWEDLTETKTPKIVLDDPEYSDRHYLVAETRNCVEQTWSQQRLEKALSVYDEDYVFIHDVSGPEAKVHTSYDNLEDFRGEILLTHSPDEFTSLHPLAHLGKSYTIEDNCLYEVSQGDARFELDADCYIKQYSEYLVGYENDEGSYFLVQTGEGIYEIVRDEEFIQPDAELVMQVELYKDIGGDYYPLLDSPDREYLIRPDGRVERQYHHDEGTDGSIVDGRRSTLSERSNNGGDG